MVRLSNPQRDPPDPGLPPSSAKALEIKKEAVRYHDKTMATHDIQAVCFDSSMEEKYVERFEFLQRVRYTFKYLHCRFRFCGPLTEAGEHKADGRIEAELFVRSEHDQAFFKAMLDKLFRYVLPGLTRRLVAAIQAGDVLQIGKLELAEDGVYATTGWLFRTDYIIPYDEFEASHTGKAVRYKATTVPKVRGQLDTFRTPNAIVLPQVVEAARRIADSDEPLTADDVVPPGFFQARVERVSKTVADELEVELLEVSIRGPISAQKADCPVIHWIRLEDITEDPRYPKPVFCTIGELQAADTVIFEYQSDRTSLPFEETLIAEWAPVAGIPIESLIFPFKGTRKLRWTVGVESMPQGIILEKDEVVSVYENQRPGYEEIAENRRRADELTVALAVGVSASDGELHRTEARIVKDWVTKRINTASASDRDLVKRRLNRATRDAVQLVKNGGRLDIGKICRELVDVTDRGSRYDIMELCMKVAGADEATATGELDLLESLAGLLEVNRDRFQAMLGNFLPLSTSLDEDTRRMLGITDDMDAGEKKAQLLREFKKWSGRVTHANPEVRERAEDMLKLIAKERTRMEKAESFARTAVPPSERHSISSDADGVSGSTDVEPR